jgi:hypothetical protein
VVFRINQRPLSANHIRIQLHRMGTSHHRSARRLTIISRRPPPGNNRHLLRHLAITTTIRRDRCQQSRR